MKKYLLMAMMVLGATGAFAGVEGTATEVSLPIYTQGEIVESTSTNLIIEAVSATTSGKEMSFDFGAISGKANTKSEVRSGEFRITKADGSALGASQGVKVGFTADGSTKTEKSDLLESKLTVNYSIAFQDIADATDVKEATGRVTAQAVVGGSDITTGQTFSDNKMLYVKVQ